MENVVQMRSLIKGIIAEGRVRPGSMFWAAESRARKYIDQRIAEPIGKAVPPAAAYPIGPAEKNASSSAAPGGRSTASAKPGLVGMVTSLFAPPPAPASAPSKPSASGRRGKKERDLAS